MYKNNDKSIKELQKIPWVGKKMAQRLFNIGIKKTSDLKNKKPENIYLKICAHVGYELNICALYVCRCAVYFASNKNHDPEKLQWWYWKDNKL